MGFMKSPSPPPPMIIPPSPPPAPQLTPTSVKPQRKAQQPSFISGALTPDAQQTGGRSLLGGG